MAKAKNETKEVLKRILDFKKERSKKSKRNRNSR